MIVESGPIRATGASPSMAPARGRGGEAGGANRVVLHVDRLVLRGVPAAQRDALVQSMTATLANTLRHDPLATTSPWAHRATLRARFAGDAQPDALGRGAALSLLRELQR